MLTGSEDGMLSLQREHSRVTELLPKTLRQYASGDGHVTVLRYPSIDVPEKIRSLNFAKFCEHEGMLIDIRGQYLIFADGKVVNIRKHKGFELEISAVLALL